MATTFASSALNVGFGVIESDLDVERTTLAWTISGYAIAAAALLLTAGRTADRVGGRRVFLAGIAAFGIGSVVCAIAPNVELLVGGRIVQGLSSAALIPSSLTLALQAFPVQHRGLAIGVWGAIAAVAGASGPPLGAALIDIGTWRSVFVVLTAISVLVFVVGRTVLVETPRSAGAGRLDVWSGPMASVAVGLVIAVLLQGQDWGWSSMRAIGALIVAATLLAAVVGRSRRHPTPFVDLGLLRQSRFASASAATALFNAATSGFWLGAPLFLQSIWGWGVLASGFGVVASPLTHLTFAVPMGRLADRGHHKGLMVGGSLTTGAALAGMALLVTETSSYWTTILPFTILFGFGSGMAWPVFTSGALLDVPQDKYGQANGMNLTMRQFGAALGVAVIVAVIGNSGDATVDDFRTAWAVLAVVLGFCALVLAAIYPTARRSTAVRPPARTS
ncbi:MAG: MFS transporter [Actinomycetota bacterium]